MHHELINKYEEYLELLADAVEQGAFETASMYAMNLSKFLNKVHTGEIRWCKHETIEEK